MPLNTAQLLPDITQLALRAGDAIMAIYSDESSWRTAQKLNDTPVTAADFAAQDILWQGLSRLTPKIPILSEEGTLPPWEERRQWHRYWLLDPLDGTREFLQRNGEFTVNIALIEQGTARLGVVYAPASETLYWGGEGLGAWKKIRSKQTSSPISVRTLADPCVVLTSRRHSQNETQVLQHLIHQGALKQFQDYSLGSSLKFCHIAEGKADLYLRLAPTSEWDTGAAQAILEAAGGALIALPEGTRLSYNQKPGLTNPSFVALAKPLPIWIDQLNNEEKDL